MADTQTRMIELLPYYLQNGENIKKYYKAIAMVFDEITQVLLSVVENRDVDSSVLYGLDVLGNIVGELRNGLEDETFRENIKTKIKRNRSYGDIEILNEFARNLLDGDFVGIFEDYNKSGEIIFKYIFPRENPTTKDPVSLLKKIMGVGIRLKTELAFYSNNNVYYGLANIQVNHITIGANVITDSDTNTNLNIGMANLQTNTILVE